jgi:hypothetical protein
MAIMHCQQCPPYVAPERWTGGSRLQGIEVVASRACGATELPHPRGKWPSRQHAASYGNDFSAVLSRACHSAVLRKGAPYPRVRAYLSENPDMALFPDHACTTSALPSFTNRSEIVRATVACSRSIPS